MAASDIADAAQDFVLMLMVAVGAVSAVLSRRRNGLLPQVDCRIMKPHYRAQRACASRRRSSLSRVEDEIRKITPGGACDHQRHAGRAIFNLARTHRQHRGMGFKT